MCIVPFIYIFHLPPSPRGTGVCLEYLLKNGVSSSPSSIALCSSHTDVLGTLVRLSEADRPSGIQAEVLRAVQNMVILLDEQFLVHSVVHKAVLRLLRNCVGDDIQEQLDNKNRKVMGAAKNVVRSSPSEYEEDREFPPISVSFLSPVLLTPEMQLSIFFAFCAAASGPFASS